MPGFHWVLFTLIISTFLFIEKKYPDIISGPLGTFLSFKTKYPEFISEGDKYFNINFIEWFGVLYGFLIPTVLVKVWEQFDETDREFDREADAINILSEDIELFDNSNYLDFKISTLTALQQYTKHVQNYYDREDDDDKTYKLKGDKILMGIRTKYNDYKILHPNKKQEKEIDPILSELISQLNNAIDIRGDRIALSKQRLFQGLRFIVLVSSVMWLLPFYFIAEPGNNNYYGLFTDLLRLGVTFLVIFVLSIIEDLDEPFGGTWKIGTEQWEILQGSLKKSVRQLKKEASQLAHP